MDISKDDEIRSEIKSLCDTLLPYDAGTITRHRLEFALKQVAQVAYRDGYLHGLASLRTVPEIAAEQGLNAKQLAKKLAWLHKRWGLGAKLGNTWVVAEHEVEMLLADHRRKTE